MPAAIDSRVLLDVARAAVESGWTDDMPPQREEIVTAVAELLAEQIASERSRCAEICRERAALWRRTPLAQAELPSAREEARARANEATYLADLIESASRRVARGEGDDLN